MDTWGLWQNLVHELVNVCNINIKQNEKSTFTYLNNFLVHIKHEGISEGLMSNRKSHLLAVPYVKYKTFMYHSFSVCGPRLWNNLNAECHQESDYDKFKKGLKTLLFNRYVLK